MIIFIPYYSKDKISFASSMNEQTIQYKVIKRDTKKDKIYWAEACNDFYKERCSVSKACQNVRNALFYSEIMDNVICIMCNDISFPANFLEEGSKVKKGQILIPKSEGVWVNWKRKQFARALRPSCFSGRCFFMTYGDFIESGGFPKWLPHYLADYDFAIRQVKRGLKIVVMDAEITHKPHPKETKVFSILCPINPIFWTIFLLRHFNRYTFINILRAWYDGLV